jgi:putative ABC transport system ATP-binding protein
MLELRNVSKVYGEGEGQVVALGDVSFRVDTGEYVAVIGHSGSGKSTLLNIIGGLDRLSSGQVILDGQRLDTLSESELVLTRRQKIAYVFQQYHLLPSLSALENVLLPLTFCSAGGQDKAMVLLNKMGIAKRARHRPGQLSGGEQQRVAIARALVNDPALVLADEPTGNVDQRTGNEILQIFEDLNAEGRTIIMVTHNPEAANRASRTIVMKDGRVVDDIRKAESRQGGM